MCILLTIIPRLNMIDETFIKEIDSAHKAANNAQQDKNFDLYMTFFTDDLQYKQLNGKTIGKKQLANDVKSYFNRVKSLSGSYHRNEINAAAGKITERLIQHSQVSIRVFIFFSKKWTIERDGIYEWIRVNGKWKICRVEVLGEKIT